MERENLKTHIKELFNFMYHRNESSTSEYSDNDIDEVYEDLREFIRCARELSNEYEIYKKYIQWGRDKEDYKRYYNKNITLMKNYIILMENVIEAHDEYINKDDKN